MILKPCRADLPGHRVEVRPLQSLHGVHSAGINSACTFEFSSISQVDLSAGATVSLAMSSGRCHLGRVWRRGPFGGTQFFNAFRHDIVERWHIHVYDVRGLCCLYSNALHELVTSVIEYLIVSQWTQQTLEMKS